MRYTKLGKRGPEVSTIGFGAWAIGGKNWGETDDRVSMHALHSAIDQGVTFIDTADVYGFGHSELLIKQVIKERGKKNIVIATKAGNDFYNASDKDDNGYGPIKQTYTKQYIMEAAEKSLKRLDVEVLDILQLHSPDVKKLEMDEPWLALEKLKQEGKILHAGWSIQSFKETEQSFILDRHKDLLDCIQVRYNLLEREAENVLFPKAMEYGTGVIVRIPILFGLLTGKFDRTSRFSGDDHRKMNLSPEKLDSYLTELESLEPFFETFPDDSKTVTSLRYTISHPACHVAIPGAKTDRQVNENCSASDRGPISADILRNFNL